MAKAISRINDGAESGAMKGLLEIFEDVEVATSETIDGLPVVTNSEKFGFWTLLEDGFEELAFTVAKILRFVHEDIFIWKTTRREMADDVSGEGEHIGEIVKVMRIKVVDVAVINGGVELEKFSSIFTFLVIRDGREARF